MSDDRSGGGFGSFLLGMAVGAVAGLLFAPEAGGATRAKLGKRLRGLRDLAEDRVGDLLGGMDGNEREEAAAAEADEPAALPSAREELERRLGEARRRRRASGRGGATPRRADTEEDDPVA